MSKINAKVFFDESGKSKDPIKTMGGLLIPNKVYNRNDMVVLNNKLKSTEFKLHWVKYTGYEPDKKLYSNIIRTFAKYSSLCSLNIINYENISGINNQKFRNMIYSKLPERIFYGLLRYQGNNTSIEAELIIEEANAYKSIHLENELAKQLNIQALYRGEHYSIEKFRYETKNKEIGVELTDLLLGIVRTIILNKQGSKTQNAKNELVTELFKIDRFYSFLSNIKYFEWINTYELKQVDFNKYIKLFLSQQNSWLDYL